MHPSELNFSPPEIIKRTRRINNEARSGIVNFHQGNFIRIGTQDFRKLFELYDEYFFDGYFGKNYNGKIVFDLSKRMTNAGGKVTQRKDSDVFKITLSTHLIFNTFNRDKRDIRVNGLVCSDRLEAVMRILEHEIVHLIELITFKQSSCKQTRFREMAHRLFLHTETTHQLVTQTEAAQRDFQLHIGDTVEFEFEGAICRGVITGIRKRATVMVEDKKGDYRDVKGKKYKKYYVPLQVLKQIK